MAAGRRGCCGRAVEAGAAEAGRRACRFGAGAGGGATMTGGKVSAPGCPGPDCAFAEFSGPKPDDTIPANNKAQVIVRNVRPPNMNVTTGQRG